ncbi:MAG TPA: hypothetical protein PKA27_14470 [Fimbriimonadaceae bacterium]|nr:hypothetical protein [Fimbriimonadaceae bacterium]
MKTLTCIFLALIQLLAYSQGIEVTIDGSKVFDQSAVIKPGTFGDEDFAIILKAAKNGTFSVSGFRLQNGAKRTISGNMSRSGALRATLNASATKKVPINGQYIPNDDAIAINSIDGKSSDMVLARFGKKLIKTGPYQGRSTDPDVAWELTVSRSSGADYNVVGFLEIDSKRNRIEGTLKANGKLLAQSSDNESVKVDGQYDFEEHRLDVLLHVTGVSERIGATLEQGKLQAPAIFGLVSKVVGNVPGPDERGDFKIAGSISQSNFTLDIIMKPPYEGQANITFDFSSPLGSTLKAGQVVELTVMSSASKSGRDKPNLAGSGFWHVEGDGAEVLEMKKTFVGTASDGKFYASVQGVTKFKVLSRGTIKITAVYAGQYWGPGGAYNWNPCTYTYKFGEKPAVDRN